MNPKKSKEFIKPTAEKLGVSEELVSDLLSFFWSDIRKAIVDMRGPLIYVPGLGTFKIKPWKLDEMIAKYTFFIDDHKNKIEQGKFVSYSRYAAVKEMEKLLDKLNNVKIMVEFNKEKKKQIKEQRNGKGITRSIKEQDSDPGGNKE